MKTIKQVKEKLKQRDKKSVVKGLILIVLIIIMILLSVQCVNRYDKRPTGYEQKVSAITEMDYSERQEYVDEKVEEGMININYLPNATFKGKTSVKFNIKNIENNHRPIIFSIYDENDRCIYQSKMIEPGYEMNSVELDKELSKGKHDCHIQIGYVEEGNGSTMFPITIEVR